MSFIEIVEEEEEFRLDIGESFFILRRFDSAVYRRIEKKHTTKKKNFRSGETIATVDDHAVNEDLLDYMITGWGNIKSPTTGEDVPCERSNKFKLPGSVKVQITEACDSESITCDLTEKKTSKNSSDT
ncbi:MAG: hypothetical protein JRD05_00765 [Deltaproteobacteria bacterium]|nr:hypothetical protein [Deltaproteobacteria bacterium]